MALDMDQAMFPQVGSLGKDYWAWVHKPTTRKSFRMFKHDFFETFASTSWWVIPVVWIPIIAALAAQSRGMLPEDIMPTQGAPLNEASFWVTFFAGFLTWTLVEYVLHRFLFHTLVDEESPFWITAHFVLHGQHHKFPMDKGRLVFPPVAGILMATPFYILFHSCLPYQHANSVMAGALLGYLCYDIMHYYLHHGHPTMKYLEDLKRYHTSHHFRDPDTGFGISSKLWDYPFHTLPKQAPTKTNIRKD